VWPPASIAPLEQYQLGSSVDLDRALAANYGQWPYTPPKPPGPSKQQIAKWIAQRNAALKAYNHAGCKYPVLVGPNECHTSAATVVSVQATLDRATHASVGCWGPHAQLTAPVCTIVRPQVSVWSHARTSSYNALQKAGCHGPAAPIVKGTPLCRKLNQRAEYFNAKAKALFKAWA
jgi:hypothetical protein